MDKNSLKIKFEEVIMIWTYEKFKGDMAIYAFCPKCNFRHNPSRVVKNIENKLTAEIFYQYNYCPMCGEYLYDEKTETELVDVVWNERDIMELYAELELQEV